MMAAWVMVVALVLATPVPRPELPTWAEVVAVPPELHAQFEAQVMQRMQTPPQRVQRVVEFMLGPEGLALEYELETTRTVAETLHDRRGNCLSFTLTFVTLARQAGLDAYVQETDQVLVALHAENMVFHSGHVNAGVRIRGQRFVIDFDRSVIATSRPPKAITDQRALAHYYNNRGAERMTTADLPAARSFFDAAIGEDPDFVSAWNNLGVLQFRSGDLRAAERAYLAALKRAPKYVPTLSNLTGLYQQLGEEKKLVVYQRRLDEMQRRDPFHNFMLGLQRENNGDDAQALNHYLRAIRLYRGEPQFHLAAARIYGRLGEQRLADRARTRAQALMDNDASISSVGFPARRTLQD